MAASSTCANELAALPVVTGGRSVGRAGRLSYRGGHRRGRRALPGLPLRAAPAPGRPPPSRIHELEGVTCRRSSSRAKGDRFGIPPEGGRFRSVVRVHGYDGLRRAGEAVWNIRCWRGGSEKLDCSGSFLGIAAAVLAGGCEQDRPAAIHGEDAAAVPACRSTEYDAGPGDRRLPP